MPDLRGLAGIGMYAATADSEGMNRSRSISLPCVSTLSIIRLSDRWVTRGGIGRMNSISHPSWWDPLWRMVPAACFANG